MTRVAVVGAGAGGLAAANLLAARDVDVTVFELGDRPGGKIGVETVDGAAFDTGPTVLTLPEVPDAIFRETGSCLKEEVDLVEASPAFRYLYPDGTTLDVHPDVESTLAEVREELGAEAADEFEGFLDYAGDVWEAAAPNFVFDEAPSLGTVLGMGLRSFGDVRAIDPMRTMWSAIRDQVSSRPLRHLLARYATYVGSHPKRAPATLNCIAWVELGEGHWGVSGGMFELVAALERTARRQGVEFRYETPVQGLGEEGAGLRVEAGASGGDYDAVVCNADVRHLVDDLWEDDGGTGVDGDQEPSMSGWTAVFRADREPEAERPPHTVLFPEDYLDEFDAIFERRELPDRPTIYVCDQHEAHCRAGWEEAVPVFAMVNAPPLDGASERAAAGVEALGARVADRLAEAGLLAEDDEVVWERTPADLARRYPGSRGAIYGAASNSRTAAFRRPANRVSGVEGLYLASGSAHPGGGVPMAMQSGRLAAEALIEDFDLG